MATIVGFLRAIGIVPSVLGASLYSEIDVEKTLVGLIDTNPITLRSTLDSQAMLITEIEITGV